MKTILLVLLVVFAFAGNESRCAPTSPSLYRLAEGSSGSQKAVRTIPDDGLVRLAFVRATPATVPSATGSPATTPTTPDKTPVENVPAGERPTQTSRLTLELTPFTNEAFAAFKPTLKSSASVDADMPLLSVEIQFPANLPAGKYTGALLLSGPDGQFALCDLELQRPPAAVLIAGQQTVNINVTRPFSPWLREFFGLKECTTVYAVDLRARNGSLSVPPAWTHERPPKGPASDTDPKRAIGVEFSPNPTPPTQAKITLKGLHAGEYVFYLRFFATDLPQDEAQKVTITVHARSSWVWAVLWLVAGSVVSFWLTKYLVYIRARAELLEQIDALKPCWTLPNCLAVAWVMSIIEQARVESSYFSFTRIPAFKSRLEKVARVVALLDRLHSLRAKAQPLPKLHRYRVERRISEVLVRIDPRKFGDEAKAQIQKDIDELERWFTEAERLSKYRADLKRSCETLKRSIPVTAVEDAATLDRMLGEIDNATDGGALDRLDAEYCRLKLLWQYRDWPEQQKLRALDPTRIVEFFAQADWAAWERLKAACARGEAQIHHEVLGGAGTPQTHEPICFTVATRDRTLNDLFVVQHGCRYVWTFERRRCLWFPHWYKSDSDGPIKVEYPSGRGRLTAYVVIQLDSQVARDTALQTSSGVADPVATPKMSGVQPGQRDQAPAPDLPARSLRKKAVKLWHVICGHPKEDDCVREKTKSIKVYVGAVESSEAETALGLRDMVERISFLGASAAGILSGLATYYHNNPDFGSVQDYISLFLIAAGFDQGRKLIQSVQTSKTASETGDASK